MNFVPAIKAGFKNYTNFKDRASRSEFWYWSLYIFIGSLITSELDIAIIRHDPHIVSPLYALFSLATLLPGISVSARRLHDVNRSGWWMLIGYTIVGLIPLIIWDCTQGTEGDNRFGTDPLAESG